MTVTVTHYEPTEESSEEYSTRNTTPDSSSARLVPLSQIVPWAGNPRRQIEAEPLQELADSIRQLGVLSPLIVRPFPQTEEGYGPRFQIVAGERRFRAAQLAGLESVPVIVRDVDNQAALLIAVAENDERVDVNPLDRARAYKRLQDGGMRQEEIAQSLNRKQPFISTYTRLLELPEEVQALIANGSLTLGHAKALFRFREFPQIVTKMAELVVAQGTSVRTLEVAELPFPNDLERSRLVKSLNSYEAAFNVKAICSACPFGAFHISRYGNGYCLKPDHYHELNEAAKQKAAEEAEARRVKLMQQAQAAKPSAVVQEKIARAGGNGTGAAAVSPANDCQQKKGHSAPSPLRLEKLRYDDYVRIDVERHLPAACTDACPCRAQALDQYGKLVNVCLQPGRLNSLKGQQTREAQKERKARFEAYRTQITQTMPVVRRAESAILLLLPGLANVRTEVRRAYAAKLPQGKFRDLLEGGRFFATEPDARDALTGLTVDMLLYHARNLALLDELHQAYDNKSDGLPWVRYFLGLKEGKETDDAPGETEETDLECDETCAGCGLPFTPDDLGQAYATQSNGVRELENGLCVTPDGTTYCTACAKETLFCTLCGKTGYEGAVFGKYDFCSDCRESNPTAILGAWADAETREMAGVA